jgi:hypothetical protein
MKGFLGGLGGLSVCFCTSLAAAQASDALAAAPEPHTVNAAPQLSEERRWYGWQGAVLDAGVVVLGINSLALASSDSVNYEEKQQTAELLLFVGAVVYGAGPPVVHLAHRQPWQALSSLGLRVALPAVGAGAGLSMASCSESGENSGECGLAAAILGTAIGAVGAMVLDASLLAWEPPKTRERSGTQLGLAPIMTSDGRRELRVVGTF